MCVPWESWRGDVSSLWMLLLPVTLPQILIPALMVTAEKDKVLVPEMSKHMEDWVREWSVLGSSVLPSRGHGCCRGMMAAEDTEQTCLNQLLKVLRQ